MSSRAAAGPPPMAAEPEAIRPADVAAAPAARVDVSAANGELTAQRDAPVGGQAVLEGVMMRGVSNWAVAVRKPAASEGGADGTDIGPIAVQSFPLVSWTRR